MAVRVVLDVDDDTYNQVMRLVAMKNKDGIKAFIFDAIRARVRMFQNKKKPT